MAKKGTKFNKYTPEFKVEVAEAYLSGKYGGSNMVAKHYNVPSHEQVDSWVKKYRESGPESLSVETRGRASIKDGVKKGRPRKKGLESMTKDEQIAYLKMENEILKKVQALRKR